MKTLLVLTAVLCLAASMSPAAILEAWVTVDNANPNVGQQFTVSIWLQVVPGAGETLDSLLNNGSGIQTASISVYQQDPRGRYSVVAPAASSNPLDPLYYPKNLGYTLTTIDTTVWNGPGTGYPPVILAIGATGRSLDGTTTYNANGLITSYTGPGDFDALQASANTNANTNPSVGVGEPVLFATETWTCLVKGQAFLHVATPYVTWRGVSVPADRYWDGADNPLDPNTQQAYFPEFQAGTMVGGTFTPGTDLALNAAIPEPATLALLGFGAVATLMRRRNKK